MPDNQGSSEAEGTTTRAKTKQQVVNKHIDEKLNEYVRYKFKDDNLWDAFKDDFENFTEEDFKQASVPLLRTLRAHLCTHGVWVKWNRNTTIAASLYEVLIEEEPTKWTIEDVLKSNETFNSNKIIHLLKSSEKVNSHLPSASQPQAPDNPPTIKPEPLSQNLLNEQSLSQAKFQAIPQLPTLQSPQIPVERDLFATPDKTSGFGKELSNLARIYNSEMKYTGDQDSFDYKMTIFLDNCKRADIPDHVLAKAYPIMLSGPAISHYYSNMASNNQATFKIMCQSTKNYFEGEEYKRIRLARWEQLSLRLVINENDGKGRSTCECLHILITELRQLQLSFNPALRSDNFLHMKLVNACRSVPACNYVCFKPSETLSGLINNLHASISTFEVSKENMVPQYFTDRRYHRQIPSSRSGKQSSSSPHQPHTSDPQSNKTKCYVCKRFGCWSRNHTKTEQEDARRRFKESISRYSDVRVDQLIAGFEEELIENEFTEPEIECDLEDLSLNASTFTEPSDKAVQNNSVFLTSFGILPDSKNMTTDLANRSFEHAITAHDPTKSENDTDTYSFSYITSGRYTSNRFYGIVIDTGASQYSTAGYNQYRAFCKVTPIPIDTSKAGTVSVQFGIGNTTSIGSVTVGTPIGNIEFHIVKTDTPFLLCPSDMDALQVTYNNLENVLLLDNRRIPVVRRFGHAFLIWGVYLHSFISTSFCSNPCFMTETELRRLHRRYGHPSAERLFTY